MSSPHDSAEPDQPDFSSFSPQDLNAEDEFGRDPMEPGAPVGRIDDEHMEPEEPVWSPPAADAQPARSPMEPEDPVFVAPVASPPKSVPTPKKKSGLGKAILVGTLAVLLLATVAVPTYWYFFMQGNQGPGGNQGGGVAQKPVAPGPIENKPEVPTPSQPVSLSNVLARLQEPKEDEKFLQELAADLLKLQLSEEDSAQVSAAARDAQEKVGKPFRSQLWAIEVMFSPESSEPSPANNGAQSSIPATVDYAVGSIQRAPSVKAVSTHTRRSEAGCGPVCFLLLTVLFGAQPGEQTVEDVPEGWEKLEQKDQDAWQKARLAYDDLVQPQAVPYRARAAVELADICSRSGDTFYGLQWCDRALSLRLNLSPDLVPAWERVVAPKEGRIRIQLRKHFTAQSTELQERLSKAEQEAVKAKTELTQVQQDTDEAKKNLIKLKQDADEAQKAAALKLDMFSTEVEKVKKENLAGSLQAIEVLRKAGTDFLNTSKLDTRLKNSEPKKPTSTAASVQQEFERRHKQWEDDQRQLGEIQHQLGDKASKAETMALANLQLMEILYHTLQAENSPVATPSVGGTGGGDLTATVVNLVSREVAAQLDPLLRAEQKTLQSQLNAAQSNLMAEIGRTGKLNASQVDGLRTEVRNEFARLQRDVPGLPDDQLARVSESVVGNVLNELARYGYVPSRVPAGAKPPAVPRGVPSNPLAARDCFAKAYNAYFQNDSALAAQQLSLAIALDPTEAIYRYYMGLVLYRQGRTNEAVAQVRTGAALEAGSEYNRNSSAAGLQRIQGPTRRWLELAKSGI